MWRSYVGLPNTVGSVRVLRIHDARGRVTKCFRAADYRRIHFGLQCRSSSRRECSPFTVAFIPTGPTGRYKVATGQVSPTKIPDREWAGRRKGPWAYRGSVNFGGKPFLPENMWKISKVPKFCMIFARQIPEFYTIIAKYFSRIWRHVPTSTPVEGSRSKGPVGDLGDKVLKCWTCIIN